MARILSLHLAATLMMVSASAFAAGPLVGDPKAGHQKNAMCAGCHGIPGWRTAYPDVYSVPKLGGQHPQYIIAALKAYKAGQRSHPTMQVIASALSDQDMADLAAYYGGGSESSTKK